MLHLNEYVDIFLIFIAVSLLGMLDWLDILLVLSANLFLFLCDFGITILDYEGLFMCKFFQRV